MDATFDEIFLSLFLGGKITTYGRKFDRCVAFGSFFFFNIFGFKQNDIGVVQIILNRIGAVKTADVDHIAAVADFVRKINRSFRLFQKIFELDGIFKLAVEDLGIVKNNIDVFVEKIGKISDFKRAITGGQKVGNIVDQNTVAFGHVVRLGEKGQVAQGQHLIIRGQSRRRFRAAAFAGR